MMNQAPPTGWETLVIVLPSILAFLTAGLGTILAFMAKSEAKESRAEGQDRGAQNEVLGRKMDDVKVMVNGGLSSAKAEIVALKSTVLDLRAQLAAERGTGNK